MKASVKSFFRTTSSIFYVFLPVFLAAFSGTPPSEKNEVTIMPRAWYVNDVWTSADVFTTGSGSDGTGNGSAAAPFSTISMAQVFASDGDTIFVDAGYHVSSFIFLNKQIKVFGANWNINPNTSSWALNSARNAESVLVSNGTGSAMIFIGKSNIEVRGFKFEQSGTTNLWMIVNNGSAPPIHNLVVSNNIFVNNSGFPCINFNQNNIDFLVNFSVIHNRFEQAAGSSMSIAGVTGLQVSGNYFGNNTAAVAVSLLNIRSALTFSGNRIDNTTRTGLLISNLLSGVSTANISDNHFSNCNTSGEADRGAINLGQHWNTAIFSGFESVLNIRQNIIAGGANGVVIAGHATQIGNIRLNQNSLLPNTGPAIKNYSPGAAGTLDASCNWLGLLCNVESRVSNVQADGSIQLNPRLLNGTDTNAATGFQPASNACPANPFVDAGNYGPACISDVPILLSGMPAGGTWSGTGLSGTTGNPTFNPAVGTQTLTYTGFDMYGCAGSDVVTIVVNENPASPTLTGSVVCANAPEGGQVSISNTLSGYSYQLFNSSNHALQSPKAGNGGTVSWTGLEQGAGYYVRVTNTGGCSALSNAVQVQFHPIFSPGSIVNSGQQICYFEDPSAIGNLADATGGFGVISYKWQSSLLGDFSDALDLANSNSSFYDLPAAPGLTTFYRRMAKDATCSAFTPSSGVWAVQINSGDPIPSGRILNLNSGNLFCTIQMAVDHSSTLNGHVIELGAGTYPENLSTGTKALTFVLEENPACATIQGNLTLSPSATLTMKIQGESSCADHDRIIVTGTLSIQGANLLIPTSAFLAPANTEILLIEVLGSSPVIGQFANSIVGNGLINYQVRYDGGDGNDVVLTRYLGGTLDMGLFTFTGTGAEAHKLQVRLRPVQQITQGVYTAGVFAIRSPAMYNVVFHYFDSPAAPVEYVQVGDKQTHQGYDYFFFQYEGLQTVNWSAGLEYPVLTLGYDCSIGNATFELVMDSFTASQNGDYYQELGGTEAQGIYYAASATGPPELITDVSSNSPVCESMTLHLNISIQGGTSGYSQTWTGPGSFQSTAAQVNFPAAISHEGYFRAVATDANGCEAIDSVFVTVVPSGNCVSNFQTGRFYTSITSAIDSDQTLDGHTLLIPASEFQEQVTVSKALLIQGVNANTPCGNPARITPESRVVASGGGGITIAAEGVTIKGLQIEADTGIVNDGYDHFTAINNHILAESCGILAAQVTTSATQPLVIQDNCVELQTQVNPNMIPNAGIVCSNIDGTHPAQIQDNNIEGAFYGYHIFGLNTDAVTILHGGRILDVMQGIAIFNGLDDQQFLPTSIGIEDLQLSGFTGHHPDIGDINFHSGIHVFTKGNNTNATVNLSVQRVEVSAVGSHTASNAGFSFVDITTGTAEILFATLDSCAVLNNANAGILLKGSNAVLEVFRSEFSENGFDPFSGLGYGIFAEEGARVLLSQNYLSNPVNQLTNSVATIGVGASQASVEAIHNHFNRNSNGFFIFNPNDNPSLLAACNWWGGTGITAVDQFAEGAIDFIPFLGSPEDTNSNLAGFQPALNACVFPTTWYVNDHSTTQDVFTSGVGDDDLQGTPRRPFRSISRALISASGGDTILIDVGRYDEQVVIPDTKNRLHLVGPGSCTPSAAAVVDFSGIVQGRPAVVNVTADSVTIEGLRFEVDLSILNSAIIASATELDTISLRKICIEPYESSPGVQFGVPQDQVAISLNYRGLADYRTASGGMEGIFLDQINVAAQVSGGDIHEGPGAIGFRYAIAMDEGSGVITRSSLQAFARDIQIRNPQHGKVRIGGSPGLSNHFMGGGLLVEEILTTSDSILVECNLFNGVGTPATSAMMTFRDNISDVPVLLKDNTLQQVRRGLNLENFRNVQVEGNAFFPRSGFQDFRLMVINTKSLSPVAPVIAQVPVSAIIRGNTFHSLFPETGGVALACYNHNSQAATFGPFILGMPLRANQFARGLEYAVLLGDQTGSSLSPSALTEFPEYNLGPDSETPMACWDRGIDIRNNIFETESGSQLPAAMGSSAFAELEDLLFHDLDVSCLGLLRYFDPLELESRVLLQGAYDPDLGRMRDQLRNLASFPSSTPYTEINADYPGSFERFNNTIPEEIAPGVLNTGGNNAIVDWVWVELRDKTDPNQVVATRSALLQADGDVVDMDGVSPLVFSESNPDSYYVLVSHRNHLASMTAQPVDLATSPVVDFSDPMLPTMGNTPVSARKILAFGVLGLLAGNAMPLSPTGREVKYHGAHNDRLAILNAVGNSTPLNTLQGVYRLEDVNLDGVVKYNGSGNDRLLILNNVGIFTPLNIIVQEPGN